MEQACGKRATSATSGPTSPGGSESLQIYWRHAEDLQKNVETSQQSARSAPLGGWLAGWLGVLLCDDCAARWLTDWMSGECGNEGRTNSISQTEADSELTDRQTDGPNR